MRSLVVLLIFLFTMISCMSINHKTRFNIESFRVINYDTIEGIMEIKFDVNYYSSGNKDEGYGSLEKGLIGSDDKVLYFGVIGDTIPNYRCKDLNFKEFIDGFNNKDRKFIGQRFDFPYKFCISSKHINKNSEIVLILENHNTKRTDTLKSNIW